MYCKQVFARIALIISCMSIAVCLFAASAYAQSTQDLAKAGKQYFWGAKSFQNGGTECAACHTTANSEGLGGGRLGPDLTALPYVPPTDSIPTLAPTMNPIFGPESSGKLTDSESAALTAYLGAAAQKASPERKKQADTFNKTGRGGVYTEFFKWGIGSVLAVYALSLLLVRRRKKSVRRDLVAASRIDY